MSSTATRRALGGLVVAVLALYTGWLTDARLPRFALDLFRLATLPPPAPPGQRPSSAIPIENSEVLIVDIVRDDGAAAVDRATLAKVIRRVVELGAVSVGVDAVFVEEKDGTEELRRAIQETGKVVLASSYTAPLPGSKESAREDFSCCGLPEKARGTGLVHVHKDAVEDRLYQMNHVYDEPGIKTKYSLPLELAAWHVGGTGRAPIEVNADAILIKPASGTEYAIPIDRHGYSLVPYLGPNGTIPAVSWKNLFDLKPMSLAAKTVFLGSDRTNIADSYPTPFHRELRSRMAGTEILAQTFQGIITAHTAAYPANAAASTHNVLLLIAVALGLTVGFLLAPGLALGVLGAAFVALWVGTYQLYSATSVILSPLGASVGLAGAGIAAVLMRGLSLHAERLKLEGLMEAYFQEEVVPGQSDASAAGAELVTRLLAAKDLIAPPGMVIDGPLGTGGMSVVLSARQKSDNREIALKLLSPQLFRDEESRNRFRREAETASAVKHPNVVGVVSSGHRVGMLFMPYIAYERVRGPTLRALLADARKMTPGRAAAITIQVLSGLSAAHAKGIVHRDIKPENVIITTDGVVKVLDFGIARTEATDDGFKTRAGIVLGTPAYMAPEVVRGQTATPAADIYATGIMLYELITGQPPFASDNVSATLVAHVEKRATPPSQKGVEMPRALESALMSMLEKTPDQRPGSAQAAAELLTPFASSIVGPQLPIAEVAGPSTAATRAVKPSLAQSGTVQVMTGAGNRLSSARLATPARSTRPNIDELDQPLDDVAPQEQAPHNAPTAKYSDPRPKGD